MKKTEISGRLEVGFARELVIITRKLNKKNPQKEEDFNLWRKSEYKLYRISREIYRNTLQ